MSRIPNLPKSKAEKIMQYADHTDSWIDMDNGVDRKTARKHTIKHHGFEIRYSVAYKNDEEDNTVGELPFRCLTFQCPEDIDEESAKDFIKRTLELFGFTAPESIKGKSGNIHYHEQLFPI